MPDPLTDCIEKHSKKQFTLREKRSEVRFSNPLEYRIDQIKVDDCAIKAGKRCDWLVNIEAKSVSVFVELKGADVEGAIDQIKRSHSELAKFTHADVTWLISSTRCPLAATTLDGLKRKYRKGNGTNLIVKNSPVEHTLYEVVKQ